MPMSSNIQVAKLTDLPACDSCVSNASVMHGTRLANNRHLSCAWIAYEVTTPEGGVALVRLNDAAYSVANGPNDEAFHNHPFYSLGLEFYEIQEIVNSPWIEDVLTMLHKDRVFKGPGSCRHFVFALKETTVDCIAESADFVGVFPTHKAAMAAASSEIVT